VAVLPEPVKFKALILNKTLISKCIGMDHSEICNVIQYEVTTTQVPIEISMGFILVEY
jgi:hypothetical protein